MSRILIPQIDTDFTCLFSSFVFYKSSQFWQTFGTLTSVQVEMFNLSLLLCNGCDS
jgi:hypothetical protein